jgi:hypothetical protein
MHNAVLVGGLVAINYQTSSFFRASIRSSESLRDKEKRGSAEKHQLLMLLKQTPFRLTPRSIVDGFTQPSFVKRSLESNTRWATPLRCFTSGLKIAESRLN